MADDVPSPPRRESLITNDPVGSRLRRLFQRERSQEDQDILDAYRMQVPVDVIRERRMMQAPARPAAPEPAPAPAPAPSPRATPAPAPRTVAPTDQPARRSAPSPASPARPARRSAPQPRRREMTADELNAMVLRQLGREPFETVPATPEARGPEAERARSRIAARMRQPANRDAAPMGDLNGLGLTFEEAEERARNAIMRQRAGQAQPYKKGGKVKLQEGGRVRAGNPGMTVAEKSRRRESMSRLGDRILQAEEEAQGVARSERATGGRYQDPPMPRRAEAGASERGDAAAGNPRGVSMLENIARMSNRQGRTFPPGENIRPGRDNSIGRARNEAYGRADRAAMQEDVERETRRRMPEESAYKKGGMVKPKTAPKKMMKGGMVTKPKAKAKAPVVGKGRPMPAFKKGGKVMMKGKK